MRKLVYNTFRALGTIETGLLEAASKEPRQAQLSRLKAILKANRQSAFGADHGFAGIKAYADYKNAVPIRDYEQLRPYMDRLIAGEKRILTREEPFMFATTSGTSGSRKYIPITESYLTEFRRASVASGYHLFARFPRLSEGVTLSVASAAEEGRTEGGVPYGAISGGLFLREPAAVRRYISPVPYEVFLIRDYETRYYTLLRLALALPLTFFYTLNPSTIALLARRLKEYGPRLSRDIHDGTISPPAEISQSTRSSISPFLRADKERGRKLMQLVDAGEMVPYKAWPLLQVVCCWTKAAAAFYLSDFPQLFADVPVCDITYGASEGRGTVFLDPDKQMLAVRSHFYEFVPEGEIDSASPCVYLADELVSGENYYILFTTAGGLYRYHINDVVKVVGFHNRTPLLEFQYKGGNISSFTGEKLTELQVTEAMSQAQERSGLPVRFFTVVGQFRPQPHYRLWIEPASPHADDQVWVRINQEFDSALAERNVEYAAKRRSGRLSEPVAERLEPGTYEALRRHLSQSGVPDSQIKVSHLNPKDEVRARLTESLSALPQSQAASG